MRTHDSSEPTTQQPEKFDEFTGGYDDIDHARAAKRLNADLRAMDATPRAGHTPGPWAADGHRVTWNGPDKVRPNLVCVANEDDARIIAAAPDLLEACRILADVPKTADGYGPYQLGVIAKAIDAARAAIARATNGGVK